jgi:hypothetical protein
MAAIDVDFEVFKALTARRTTESDTYNDVIRRLLMLNPTSASGEVRAESGCVMRGVRFPEGTLFSVTYKGRTFEGSVRNGVWTGSDGVTYSSPSRAAHAITGNNVNGWRFWLAKRPNDIDWKRLDEFR